MKTAVGQMTPGRFIKKLSALVAANRSLEALHFWREHFSEMAPSMTSKQVVWVADLMHMADVATDSDDINRNRKPAAQAARPS